MTERENELGKLQAVYGTSPALLQRAAIVAVLSFVFFLAMLFAYSLTRKFIFFMLGTAFLIVEFLVLFGWQSLRRGEFKFFENGFEFKKQSYLWDEIKSAAANGNGKQKGGYKIEMRDGREIVLSETMDRIGEIVERIEGEIARRKWYNQDFFKYGRIDRK
ncbi:MAG: hypothetical protein ACR2N3_16155 [Pyrinomonadaceae bacterium]